MLVASKESAKQACSGEWSLHLVAGCVAIKVASKDTVKVVRTLDAGQAFGELALLKTGGRRAASVVTSMASEFLTIDGKQYQLLLAQLQREELKAKVDVLRRAPLFRSCFATVIAVGVVLVTTALYAIGGPGDMITSSDYGGNGGSSHDGNNFDSTCQGLLGMLFGHMNTVTATNAMAVGQQPCCCGK